MMTLRNIAALILILATTAAVSAAEEVDRGAIIDVNYSLAVPLGETRTHTAQGSFQGLGMGVLFHRKHMKVGFEVSWQVFREDRQAPGTLSGAQYEARTTNLVPILASGYYVWRHGTFRTFVGAGAGGMLANRRLTAFAEETTDTTWYAAASGIAGAALELTPGFGLESKLRYVGGFKSGEKPIGMMQLTLGLVFFF